MKLLLIALLCAISYAQTDIQANDDRIVYIGRFEKQNGKASFSWSNSQIGIIFQASSIVAKLKSSNNGDRYLVYVDEKLVSDFTFSSETWSNVTLAKNLDTSARHVLWLWKVTEDLDMDGMKGVSHFGGFSLSEGGEYFKGIKRKERRLEFIGDSDTAGWCADGSWYKNGWKHENSAETYAAKIARELDADIMSEAISGYGVLSEPVQPHWLRTLGFVKTSTYDFQSYTPDAVVMLIGPNDPSIKKQSQFVNAYLGFMKLIAAQYGYASVKPKIIHVCGGSINGLDPCDAIQEANDKFNKDDINGFKGYYTSVNKGTWEKMNDWFSGYKGCESHYNPKGHTGIAKEIAPQIRKIMGW